MVLTDFSKQAIRFGMMFDRVRYTFWHFNTDSLWPFLELFSPPVTCNYCCYNMTKSDSPCFFFYLLVRQYFVCCFSLCHRTGTRVLHSTISIYGFYFLLQAAKMGESDTYSFSIEVRASYTLVKIPFMANSQQTKCTVKCVKF